MVAAFPVLIRPGAKKPVLAAPPDNLVAYLSGAGISAGADHAWDIEHREFWGGVPSPEVHSIGVDSVLPSGNLPGLDAFGNDDPVLKFLRASSHRIVADLPTFGFDDATVQFWFYPFAGSIAVTPFEFPSADSFGSGVTATINTINTANITKHSKWKDDTAIGFTGNTGAFTLSAWNFLSFEWSWSQQKARVYHGTAAGGTATGSTLLTDSLSIKSIGETMVTIGNRNAGTVGFNAFVHDYFFLNKVMGNFAATRPIPAMKGAVI